MDTLDGKACVVLGAQPREAGKTVESCSFLDGWRPRWVSVLLVAALAVVGAAAWTMLRLHPSLDQRTSQPTLFDYQAGQFGQWSQIQSARASQVEIVTTPARSGYPETARFIVAPGDYTNKGKTAERAEVMASITESGTPSEGDTQWYGWSSFFPTGTYVDAPNGWLIFTQWHQSGDAGVPNIDLSLSKTDPVQAILSVSGQSLAPQSITPTWRNEWWLGVLPLNQWVDFTVGITWSADPAVGHIAVKMNGVQVADAPAATLYAGMSAYLKQGIYRKASAQTHTIYHTGTRRGPTEASVRL